MGRSTITTSALALLALVACSVSERPADEPGTTRELADFDPAVYRIVPIAELDDEPIFVDRDGERVELASVVDADLVVLERAGGEPIDAGPAADGLGLAADNEPEAFCSCRYDRDYSVPHKESVWSCTNGPLGAVCSWHMEVVYHWVTCTSTCTSCLLYTCTDHSTGAVGNTTPQPQYLIDSHPHECWDGTCP